MSEIKSDTEIFRATSFDCPRCGEMMYVRKNLDILQMFWHPTIRCSCCHLDVTKADLIFLMLRQKTRDGYSFICDDCGRSNVSLTLPEKCEFCARR